MGRVGISGDNSALALPCWAFDLADVYLNRQLCVKVTERLSVCLLAWSAGFRSHLQRDRIFLGFGRPALFAAIIKMAKRRTDAFPLHSWIFIGLWIATPSHFAIPLPLR